MPKSSTSKARKTPSIPKQKPVVFEVAWEVCHKLGGIYTVMRTKIPAMVKQLGSRYHMIGPYIPESTPMEFEESTPSGPLAEAITDLRAQGIGVHFGYWLCSGRPPCILFDIRTDESELASIKYHYWQNHAISLPGYFALLDEVMVFGDRVTRFFEALSKYQAGKPIIAHFHEWMAGTSIPEIARLKLPVGTIFTTHATMLGRHLAMDNPWFYNQLSTINWEQSAAHYGIDAQVRIERAAAHLCTVFTTVSDVTGQECEFLLGRKPDLILPNGLNISRYSAVHEFQNLHRINKEQIHRFTMGHFFPSYSFDLSETCYVFTSGRFEYHNKGFDLTIEALARLNARLKQSKSSKTIVFFLITKQPTHFINPDVMSRRAMMEEMESTVQEVQKQVGERLFMATAQQKRPKLDSLVDERWTLRLRQFIHAWKTDRLPPIVTHNLQDDANDPVLNQLRALRLLNAEEDRVKVVYHPDFISSQSPLFGLEYPQFVRGCHLGIFPSCYEPWGYTPMECVASGIPAVTSDFSGFGAYLVKNLPNFQRNGLCVINRRNQDFSSATNDLADYLEAFLHQGLRDRVKMRNRVEAFSENFAWAKLSTCYAEARDLALAKLPPG